MNSRELSADVAMSRVNVNFDIGYEELMRAIEGYELILQEGVLMHMGPLLSEREYANQVCLLASLMQQVRAALLLPPVQEEDPCLA